MRVIALKLCLSYFGYDSYKCVTVDRMVVLPHIPHIPDRQIEHLINESEWISLTPSDYSRKKWRAFKSLNEYLDHMYGQNNWQVRQAVGEGLVEVSTTAAVEPIVKSVVKHVETHPDLSEDLQDTYPFEEGLPVDVQRDSTELSRRPNLKLLPHLLYRIGLKLALAELGVGLPDEAFEVFEGDERVHPSTIPLVVPEILLPPTIGGGAADKPTVENFLRNNLVVQVRTSVLVRLTPVTVGIYLREDVKMGKGKKGVQAAHGAVSLLFQPHSRSKYHEGWLRSEEKPLMLYHVRSLGELLALQDWCQKHRVNEALIADAGHTQVASGTRTCVAVGPLPAIWLELLAERFDAVKWS